MNSIYFGRHSILIEERYLLLERGMVSQPGYQYGTMVLDVESGNVVFDTRVDHNRNLFGMNGQLFMIETDEENINEGNTLGPNIIGYDLLIYDTNQNKFIEYANLPVETNAHGSFFIFHESEFDEDSGLLYLSISMNPSRMAISTHFGLHEMIRDHRTISNGWDDSTSYLVLDMNSIEPYLV
jgi:hypothetical protein